MILILQWQIHVTFPYHCQRKKTRLVRTVKRRASVACKRLFLFRRRFFFEFVTAIVSLWLSSLILKYIKYIRILKVSSLYNCWIVELIQWYQFNKIWHYRKILLSGSTVYGYHLVPGGGGIPPAAYWLGNLPFFSLVPLFLIP